MSSTDGRPLVSTQDSGPESNKSGTGLRTTHLPEWSRSIGIITSGTAVKWTMARKVERVLGITIMDRLCMRESSKKESRAEKALTMMKMAI